MSEIDKRRVFQSRLALRDMRLRVGATEQALAPHLGRTIQAWEKGERPVRKAWLKLATGCLKCGGGRNPFRSLALSVLDGLGHLPIRGPSASAKLDALMLEAEMPVL